MNKLSFASTAAARFMRQLAYLTCDTRVELCLLGHCQNARRSGTNKEPSAAAAFSLQDKMKGEATSSTYGSNVQQTGA